MKKLVAILMTTALLAGYNLQTIASRYDNDGKNDNNTTMTTSLKIHVVDEDKGEALTGVKLKIKGEDVSSYTDFEGNFKLQDLKPGKYNIETSFISYKDKVCETISLELNQKNEMIIKMKSVEE